MVLSFYQKKFSKKSQEEPMKMQVRWRNCHYLPIRIGPCLLVTSIIHPVYYGASEVHTML